MVTETDLELGDGHRLHVYDTGADEAGERLAVLWHHGTPNTGAPPEPLFPAAERCGVRWISYDRPGYGRSTPVTGRGIASAAEYAARVADSLGIERFAVMGHSGGGTHALACGALLGPRVLGAVCVSGLAPRDADDLDWQAGMARAGASRLGAAAAGRAALEAHLAAAEWDPEEFTPEDHAALAGEWSWLGTIAGQAIQGGRAGMLDDELAYVAPWGFDPREVRAPALLVQGGRDRIVPRSHGEWLARRIPGAELWLRPADGHVSVLAAGPACLEWLAARARDASGLRATGAARSPS